MKHQPKCKHGLVLCDKCITVTDAAKRMSDHLNLMLIAHNPWDIRNKWMAFNLQTGESDGVLYDSRQDAINHMLDERFYAYFCFKSALGGTNAKDCQIYLDFHRIAYDNRMRLHEPAAPQLIMPTKVYDGKRYYS